MSSDSDQPEQSLFDQWRAASDASNDFEKALSQRALDLDGGVSAEGELRERQRLRLAADLLYAIYMSDMNSNIKKLSS